MFSTTTTASSMTRPMATARPPIDMADQARNITARTPDTRLAVTNAGTELDAVATSFNHVLDRLAVALVTQRRFMRVLGAIQ